MAERLRRGTVSSPSRRCYHGAALPTSDLPATPVPPSPLPGRDPWGLVVPILLAVVLLAVAPARAATVDDQTVGEQTVGDLEWALSAGAFDVGRDQEAAEFGLEVRLPTYALPLGRFELPVQPAVGALGTDDGGGYGYLGFRVPLGELWPDRWPDRWRVVPYTGVGIYTAGDGKDLGGPVEFRSGLEVSYRGGERWWLGVNFYHLSNGVLYDRNPGSESLVLTLSWR